MMAKVVTVGTVTVHREENGDIEISWPGWCLERDPEKAAPFGLAVANLPPKADPSPVNSVWKGDPPSLRLGGQKIWLGAGPGPHVTISNKLGTAEKDLASIRVAVDHNGQNGYTVDDLARIAEGGE